MDMPDSCHDLKSGQFSLFFCLVLLVFYGLHGKRGLHVCLIIALMQLFSNVYTL